LTDAGDDRIESRGSAAVPKSGDQFDVVTLSLGNFHVLDGIIRRLQSRSEQFASLIPVITSRGHANLVNRFGRASIDRYAIDRIAIRRISYEARSHGATVASRRPL